MRVGKLVLLEVMSLLLTIGCSAWATTLAPAASVPTRAATASLTEFQTRRPLHTPTLPSTHTPISFPTRLPLTTVPPSPTATASTTVTLTTTGTPQPTTTPTPITQLVLTPGRPQGYLDRYRLVAFYGSPTGPGLGILGDLPREQMLEQLRETAEWYQPFSPNRAILPTYHMIVDVANPHPPYYFHRVDLDLIEEWVAAAEEAHVAVILDIQPGRGVVYHEFERVQHLLYEPHVHLAIDPEFTMDPGEAPGQQVGQLYAAPINEIQATLNEIGREIGLNRVLILHQFADSMLPEKGMIEDYPFVELVIDGDGVGSPTAKIRNYNQYAQEPGFEYGGFKLFPRDGDYPVLTPAEVMTSLAPPPVIIIYQ